MMGETIDRRGFLVAAALGLGASVLVDRAKSGGDGAPSAPAGVTDVERAWDRIEAWMGAHAPEALDALNPGADGEAIRKAEEGLGMDLPEPFRRSVARHDGQSLEWPSLVEFGFLMPLQDVVAQLRVIREALEGTEGDANWWRPGWVPVVARDGDHLALDLARSPRGEVWCFLHDDDPTHSRVAPDFGVWLGRWADGLEAGAFTLDRAPGAGLVPRTDRSKTGLWPH